MNRKVRPGDLITFSGLIGHDRGPCMVLAVIPFKGGVDLYYMTPLCKFKNARVVYGSVLSQGIERINDE